MEGRLEMKYGGKVGVGARVLPVTPSFCPALELIPLEGKKNTYAGIVYIMMILC
jgi:hypothetical protein